MSTSTIDDQNLADVTYTGNWVVGGTVHEYNDTVTSSTNVGDYFAVQFNGNGISVYGTIDSTSQGVVTSYSIDGAPAAQVTAPAETGDTYQQQFWASNQVPLGQHHLVVTMVKVNAGQQAGEGTVWFDFFNVSGSTTTSTSSTPTVVLSQTPTVTVTSFITPTPTSTQPSKATHTGAIIGGVVGGLGLALLVAFIAFLYYRRRRQIPANEKGREGLFPAIDINQRIYPSSQPGVLTTQGSSLNPVGVSANTTTAAPLVPRVSNVVALPPTNIGGHLNRTNAGQVSSYDSGEPGASGPSRTFLSYNQETGMSQLRQHVDSGARHVGPKVVEARQEPVEAGPTELPPVYTAV